ncbi:NAD(P)-dependent oxidoreductase [Nocardioides sp.]|uniref:NAD(P)-dependent oxidoreductase n=1 Tax=Nocardioides sp. TaxID=35761 RepID=UPI0027358BC5|nr:NAD(P)-dependent oxidoreductase [Nocardioides sp.]MDP3889939.1 NAD(P)-dependent oxidoreductase [Nocardioides sp.]
MSGAGAPAVGFVGLGQIGRPMAERLASWPGGLWVHDVAPEPVAALEAQGAKAASSLSELAASCDLVSVMVRDDDQVREVVAQLLAGAREGLTIAIHSTVAPDTPGQLADVAARHGVHVVDAPVSGGSMGAAAGTLAIMVGGTAEAYAVCEGPFAAMGSVVVRAGEVGDGTRMKLARNLMHFVAFTATTEAARLAEASGLDLVELGRIVRHTDTITGGPGAIMHRDSAGPLAADDPWRGIFEHVWALGSKDLTLAIDLGRQLGVDTPLASLALERMRAGLGLVDEEGAV